MKPYRKIQILFLTLVFCRTMMVYGECSLKLQKENGMELWKMGNDVVEIVLVPERAGSVEDMRLKSSGKMTLRSLVGKKNREIVPGTGVCGDENELPSGIRDALWRNGLKEFNLPYQLKVIKDSTERIVVLMSLNIQDWLVEKEISLSDHESILDIKVRLQRTSDEKIRRSYWFQSFLRLADTLLSMPGDDNEILHMPARVEERSLQDVTQVVREKTVIKRNPDDKKNCFVPAGQPWCGAVDKAEKLVFGMVLPEKMFSNELIYYSCPGREFYSLEVIFPQIDFEKGITYEYDLSLLNFKGLTEVQYMTREYALQLICPIFSKEGSGFQLVAVSSCLNQKVEFNVLLKNKEKTFISKSIIFSSLVPDKPSFQNVFWKTPVDKGHYQIWIKSNKGEVELFGQGIEVQ